MEAAVTATPKVLGSHRQGGFTERVLEAEFYIEMPLRAYSREDCHFALP
jgi:hypothetical protein